MNDHHEALPWRRRPAVVREGISAGAEPGSEYDRARQPGIRILDEEQLVKLARAGDGKPAGDRKPVSSLR